MPHHFPRPYRGAWSNLRRLSGGVAKPPSPAIILQRLRRKIKAVAREREKLRAMTDKSRCYQPLPELIGQLNQHLNGWDDYFRPGFSRKAFRKLNNYVRLLISSHLQRHSQRP